MTPHTTTPPTPTLPTCHLCKRSLTTDVVFTLGDTCQLCAFDSAFDEPLAKLGESDIHYDFECDVDGVDEVGEFRGAGHFTPLDDGDTDSGWLDAPDEADVEGELPF
ncbi:MAG: hypothetical protein SFW67_17530 [Myxococcaceae bacterium]|nr:hypothetical protein [Myxococcaceae bacterium]